MGLHEESDEQSFPDFRFENEVEELDHKKRVRRMLEDRLERKRLREEFKDDFDELNGEFDWDDIEK